MKTMIFILILFTSALQAQTQQDSVKLKTGALPTKATFSEKKNGKVVKYKTVYLNQSDKTLFVIAYDCKKQKWVRKTLPKNIEID